MEKIFFILVTAIVTVSTWEYFSGKVFDIAFTKILARRREAQSKFFRILSVQLAVWIFLLALLFLAVAVILGARAVDLRRVRSYIILIFIVIIFPFALIRKRFAEWVKKTVTGNKKK